MKIVAALTLAIITGTSLPVFATNDLSGHAGHNDMPAQSNANAALTSGVVKKVDKSAGKVTVSHGPLPNGMPAMTMVFKVKDMAWLDQLKDGGNIRFAADQVNGTMTIIRLVFEQ